MTAGSILTDAALLERLVAFDTTSRLSNLPLVDFVCDYLDRPGLRIERLPSEDGSKANLLAMAGPVSVNGAGLTLSGHMDVVPADEPEWRSPPFQLTRTDDAFVGRGAADMKGFLALAINRMARTRPDALRRPLALLLTYDEEVGTLGARRFSEQRAEAGIPRDVIIGEPTSLRVVRLHKGMLRLRLDFRGRAAHSGYPHLGRNAIEPAAHAVSALGALRAEMEAERPPHAEHFPEVPYAALNVGMIAGGSAANVIPDHCTIQLGIRLLPGMGAEAMAERIRASVAAVMPDEAFELRSLGESPAMMLDEGAELHRDLCALVGQRGSASVAFATDAGWLQRIGLRCAVFGPGSIEVAHRPNESIPIAEFERAGDLLDLIIRARCLQS